MNDTEGTNGKDPRNKKPEVSDESWDLRETWLADIDREEYFFKLKILPEGSLNNLPGSLHYVVDEMTRIRFFIRDQKYLYYLDVSTKKSQINLCPVVKPLLA